MKKNILIKEFGLSYPEGFKVSGINSGIKSYKKDLGLILSDNVCKASLMVTENSFKAHPIRISLENLKHNSVKAILVNSGNANCLNGIGGYNDAKKILKKLSQQTGLNENNILVASTGLIGKRIDLDKVLGSLKSLVTGLSKGKNQDRNFAEAITTTDTKIKMVSTEFKIQGKKIKISGICKGSGMINPNLATMLVFFTTDINIENVILDKIFKTVIKKTFNKVNIDSQTSTNDMAVILSSSLASNFLLKKYDKHAKIFESVLYKLSDILSWKIAEDAEGATKLIKVTVKGAFKKEDAKKIANLVANSMLVKTFIYGVNPNWGRIIQAMGKANVNLEPAKVKVKVNDLLVFKNLTIIYDKSQKNILKKDNIFIDINLNQGQHEDYIITSDLTPDYVKINSKY